MNRSREWVVAAVASAIVPMVAAAVIFVEPTPRELVLASALGWLALTAALWMTDLDHQRLSRFAVVFCGTLVGLTLLVALVTNGHVLSAGIWQVFSFRFAVPINPVMAVLVGGAVALSYYGVFEWDDENGEQPA